MSPSTGVYKHIFLYSYFHTDPHYKIGIFLQSLEVRQFHIGNFKNTYFDPDILHSEIPHTTG